MAGNYQGDRPTGGVGDGLDSLLAGLRGVGHGLTSGLSTYLGGNIRYGMEHALPGGDRSYTYTQALADERAQQQADQAQHPVATTLGNIAGGVGQVALTGGGGALAQIGKQTVSGAVNGFTANNATTAGDALKDTAVGGTVGATLGTLGAGASYAAKKIVTSRLVAAVKNQADAAQSDIATAASKGPLRVFLKNVDTSDPDAVMEAARQMRGMSGPMQTPEMQFAVNRLHDAAENVKLTPDLVSSLKETGHVGQPNVDNPYLVSALNQAAGTAAKQLGQTAAAGAMGTILGGATGAGLSVGANYFGAHTDPWQSAITGAEIGGGLGTGFSTLKNLAGSSATDLGAAALAKAGMSKYVPSPGMVAGGTTAVAAPVAAQTVGKAREPAAPEQAPWEQDAEPAPWEATSPGTATQTPAPSPQSPATQPPPAPWE